MCRSSGDTPIVWKGTSSPGAAAGAGTQRKPSLAPARRSSLTHVSELWEFIDILVRQSGNVSKFGDFIDMFRIDGCFKGQARR